MATRSAKLYQGEDESPVLDYTDLVIWEESEFGTRAWQGEGSASNIVIRDPLGEQGNASGLLSGLTAKSLAAKNLFVVELGTDYLFRGRVGVKNYSRDQQHVERYRQVECNLHDTNWDLDHIFVHNYPRPAETDNARVQGLIASYLSGSPRATTALNGSNFLAGSNTVNLSAQTFTRTSPLAILRETSLSANKQFFVTGDAIGGGSLFWDGNDSTVYQAGLRISDRQSEIDTTLPCGTEDFAPVGSLGAAASLNGANELSQVVPGPRAEVADLILAQNAVVGQSIVAIVGHTHNANPANAIWDDAGNTYTLAAEHRKSISGDQPRVLIYYSNLTANLAVGQKIRWEVDVGSSILGTDETDARVISAWLFDGTLSAPVESGTGSGFTASPSVAVGGSSGLLVAGLITKAGDTDTITDDGDWTSFTRTIGTVALSYSQLAGGFRVNDTGGETWSGTISQIRDWAMVGAYFTTGGSADGAGLPTFPPIWNVGPSSTEDGSQQICEVVLFYGTGGEQYVTAHNLTVHNQYGHSSETFTDDSVPTAAAAQVRANSILAHRQYEDKTYNVTIGPLTDDYVTCVKHGQTIWIKARAIPDADDQFRLMRIVQCRYTTPVVGTWFAHLQLGRPWKMQPYGTGPTLTPSGSAAAGSTIQPVGVTGSDSAGTDSGTYADANHVHSHPSLTSGGPYHMAEDVTFAPTGTIAATDVQAAIAEAASESLTNPMTSVGDVIKGGTAGTPERLAIGASNTIFKSTGASPLWANTARLSYLDVEEHTPPNPPSPPATVLRIYGSNSKGYVKNSSGTVVELGGSGGGGAGAGGRGEYASKYNPDHETPSTTPSIAEEFNGSRAGGWSWTSAPATDDLTTYPGFNRIKGDSTARYLNIAWVPGASDVTLVAKISHMGPGDAGNLGIYVGDTTGDPANLVMVIMTPTGVFDIYNRNAGTFAVVGSSAALTGLINAGTFYLRLTRLNSGPTWTAYASADGVAWLAIVATSSKALTVGAMGLRLDNTSDYSIDWIRGWTSVIEKVGA